MVVALALQQPADLSVVYPEFYPVAAGIGSSIKTKQKNKKMDGWTEQSFHYLSFSLQ